jgi:cell division protein FtsN
VQIEAATNRAGIERHRDALALAGVEGRVEEFVRGAVTYYRLRVGCYPTKEEAHARAATVIPTLRANQIGAHPLVFLNDQAVR